MDYKSILLDSIESKFKPLPENINVCETISDHVYAKRNSFNDLDNDQKDVISVLALNDSHNFDGYDLMMQLDKENIVQLLYRHKINKEITAEQVINLMLKNIIAQHDHKFDQEFQTEFEKSISLEVDDADDFVGEVTVIGHQNSNSSNARQAA